MRKQGKAHGYIRVSTDGQVRDGVSLEAQQERIRQWVENHGYELDGIVEDAGFSGKSASNRPGLQEVLTRARRGDVVVVYSLSRLARSTKDTIQIAEDLERRGVDLVSITESLDSTTAAGKMLFRLLAVLGEFERDLVAERTSLALRHLQRQGRYVGGHIPYGMTRGRDGLACLEGEQAAMRFAVELRAQGKSLRQISQLMAMSGMTNRLGRPLAATQVGRMVRAWEWMLGAGLISSDMRPLPEVQK